VRATLEDKSVIDIAARRLPWLPAEADSQRVILSSRVRLARNLARYPFPAKADAEALRRVCGIAGRIVPPLMLPREALVLRVGRLGPVSREILKERRALSPDLLRSPVGRAVILALDESLSVMVNEEDHLRIQSLVAGFHPEEAYAAAAALDRDIWRHVSPAFREDIGFLTACPTNVGTGLRASVMVHLPGLGIADRTSAVANALAALGYAVRGALGEGTRASANLFQISNQTTLGESESTILRGLKRVAERVAEAEEAARMHLWRRDRARLYDHVGRAFGILRHGRMLTSEEALNCLSALRLGAELGMFSRLEPADLDGLFRAAQPGHFQADAGREMGSDERNVLRSEQTRTWLCTRFPNRV
jgi:protein arginine kinase